METPPQPKYILRGHASAIHAVQFLRNNTRLLTGDADGWTILWDTTTKRPAAVWRAHSSVLLGLGEWDDDKIITHGRDSKLNVWKFTGQDEAILSKQLPVEFANEPEELPCPWLLHSLKVNTLNFCSFAIAQDYNDPTARFIAVPGEDEGNITVYSLPDEQLLAPITYESRTKVGMVMAIALKSSCNGLTVVAAYEIGSVIIWQQTEDKSWTKQYSSKLHDQPILSIDLDFINNVILSCGADAIIGKYTPLSSEQETSKTGHSGQQSLRIRSDCKIFATAGWDGKGRVYSCKTLKEVAVLKWHKEGCQALDFAQIEIHEVVEDSQNSTSGSGLQSLTSTVATRRSSQAQTTHWLALGSKDGKVSLWDIF